jgi:hypothetical protein
MTKKGRVVGPADCHSSKTGPPNLIGFDFVLFLDAFTGGGRAVFGEGEAEGPDRAIRAAEAAIADIRQQLRSRDRQ